MARIDRSALVRCPASAMFGLINHIERYPAFVPGCSEARILSDLPLVGASDGCREVIASLVVERRGLKETLTTRNRCWPDDRVELSLIDGPLARLDGEWRLQPFGELGCEVALSVDYELRNGLRLVGRAIRGSIGRVADDVLNAFCRQAEAVG